MKLSILRDFWPFLFSILGQWLVFSRVPAKPGLEHYRSALFVVVDVVLFLGAFLSCLSRVRLLKQIEQAKREHREVVAEILNGCGAVLVIKKGANDERKN